MTDTERDEILGDLYRAEGRTRPLTVKAVLELQHQIQVDAICDGTVRGHASRIASSTDGNTFGNAIGRTVNDALLEARKQGYSMGAPGAYFRVELRNVVD